MIPKKILGMALAVFLLGLLPPGPRSVAADGALDWWTMFRHDPTHAAYSTSSAPDSERTLWTYATGGYVFSSPAVANGKVYVGSYDGKLYCLDALTGATIWTYATGDSVQSSPAIAEGRVYVGSLDGKLYCLNALTATLIWAHATGGLVQSSPAVANGKVYVGSHDGKLYCLDAVTGGTIWSYPQKGYSIYSSPAVANGKVYVGAPIPGAWGQYGVLCLDASTGEPLWEYTAGDTVDSSPAVTDGKLYVGSNDGKVYCLDALTGTPIWAHPTGDAVRSSPAVADGKLYVGSYDGKLYCLDALTGGTIWTYATGDRIESSPAVADGKVYVGSLDYSIFAIEAAPTRPDLVVEEIAWYPTYPVNGSLITINVTVSNIGNGTAVPYFTGQLSGDAFDAQTAYYGSGIGPGGMTISTFAGYVNTSGDLTLRYRIDAEDQVIEWDETNNEKAFQITVLAADELPDLVVTDIWHDQDQIWCQVMNRGNGRAPAGARVDLWMEGNPVSTQTMDGLAPGERRYVQWDQIWSCTASMEPIRVCIDAPDLVPESDETNNCRAELWRCDEDAPAILEGPFVTPSADSATISWQTSEPCSGIVRIDDKKPIMSRAVSDPSFSTDHKITVTGLSPSTCYAFLVQSSDAGGNTIRSSAFTFSTEPAQDPVNPTITLDGEIRIVGRGVIGVNASDDVGVRKVEFYLDGEFRGADYSYPYELLIDSETIGLGVHDVVAQVVDLSGNSAESWNTVTVGAPVPRDGRPIIAIQNPRDGDTISDEIEIRVLASDLDGMDTVEIYLDGYRICTRTGWPSTRFRHTISFDLGDKEETPAHEMPALTLINITLPFDTLNWENGPHQLRVRGWDVGGNTTEHVLGITIFNAVPRHHPSLVITRPDVELRERPGGSPGLVAGLVVRNAGDAPAENVTIEDVLHGLYPTGSSYTDPSTATTVSGRLYRSACLGSAIIRIPTLGAGETLTIRYAVTPILRESYPSYNIGATVALSYNGTQGDQYSESLSITASDVRVEMESPPRHWLRGETVSLADAVEACLSPSDYLIVTCPSNMNVLPGTEDEIGLLVQSMARLAWLRNGALGFLDSHSADQMRSNLCELIWEGGDWSSQLRQVSLSDRYSANGYLLIVGETEIVPSWNHGSFDISWADSETPKNVDHCDTDYGDSNGNWLPEIIVGRIIGENAVALRAPIDASIAVAEGDVDFGGSSARALLISGYGDHYEQFESNLAGVSSYFSNDARIRMHDFFELDSFTHHFTRYDGLAVGDVTGGGAREIAVSKDDDHRLYVYSAGGTLLMDEPYTDFDGDCILRIQRTAGLAYLAILDPSAGRIRTRSADGTNTGSRSITVISGYCDFAVGDVDGDGDEEYVVASDATNTIYVYDAGGDSSFSFQFTDHDSIAVGNVMGDGKEEIVIAKDDDNTIKIYDQTGARLATITSGDWTYYSPDDRLAVGDVCGDGMEEIVIAMNDDGYIRAYNATGHQQGKVELGFTRYDQLALGDLYGDSKEEIVLARDDDRKIIIADLYWATRIIDEIQRLSPGSDVIFFNGHGNVNNWNCFHTDNVPASFGSSTPFVYAVTCLSGNYESGAIAERFLQNGAAVYIGSTMVSCTCVNSWAAETLYQRWVGTTNTIGQAFKQIERDVKNHFSGSGHGQSGAFWVAEYNLYGDPKFGRVSSVGSLGALAAPETPPTRIEVSIPEIQVASLNGYDQVWIPGGGFTMENGMPQLPTYATAVPIPEGWQVGDVTLISKGGGSVLEGLNIPAVYLVNDTTILLQQAPEGGYPEGIYPEEEYSWELVEGDLGYRSLIIRICPAKYNMLTAQLQSWETYTFAIDSYRSVAVIADAHAARSILDLGDTLCVETRIDLADQGEVDVFLDGEIRSCTTGQIVGGVRIQRLRVAGATYTTIDWEVENVTSGAYALDLHLTDGEGRQIDSESVRFWVGACKVNVTSVAVEPANVEVDGSVTVAFTVASGEDSTADGMAFVWLMDDRGRKIIESPCNLTILPGASTDIRRGFQLDGLDEGQYWIGVHASLNSEPSEVRYAQVNIPECACMALLPMGLALLLLGRVAWVVPSVRTRGRRDAGTQTYKRDEPGRCR